MGSESVLNTKFVIARNIKYRRMALGMTQTQLGDRVHLGKNAVSRREQGYSSVEAEHLPRFAEALGVEVGDLFEVERFYRE
jgi:transcriptional regulator with XRE-family HTH domain